MKAAIETMLAQIEPNYRAFQRLVVFLLEEFGMVAVFFNCWLDVLSVGHRVRPGVKTTSGLYLLEL